MDPGEASKILNKSDLFASVGHSLESRSSRHGAGALSAVEKPKVDLGDW
jgi:hypothetical protein